MKDDDLEALFARVRTWAPDLKAEAVDALLALEEDADDYYEPTEEELADIREGLAEEERGEFATEEEIARVFRRRI
jgi:predicted transcriptional regulator